MRIISGKARGIKLDSPNGLNTRPTTDRVKENIFNIIQFEVVDADVLDLFAGTGALGIEALSRGAKSLVSVDSNSECGHIIKANLKRAKLDVHAIVLNKNVESFFSLSKDKKFDIVFADPPYGKGLCDYVLSALIEGNHLSENAVIVLEHSKDDILSIKSDKLCLSRQKTYGNIAISIYRRISE